MPDPLHTSGPSDAAASSRHPLPGEVIAGKYRVDGVVGTGGMGVVVAAQHVQLGQSVAIKLLSIAGLDAERSDEARTRFLREGRAAAQLSSDHVVRVYDVGTLDDGVPFMVMELLRGEDLATLFERRGPAPAAVAADFIVQACDAVGEAHAAGIVHRDLKPSNLFVCRRNDGRVAIKVLDFGISKALNPASAVFDGHLTETRTVVGSPFYMSPEQVRDSKRVDARTDIWSLGTILYELLTGEPAFDAETLPGICAAIAADQPVSVLTRRAGIDPALDSIVMRCLEKDPARRFQTVAELVAVLMPFVERSPAKSAEYAAPSADAQPSTSAGARSRQDQPTQIEASRAAVTLIADASAGPPARPATDSSAGASTGTLLSPSVRDVSAPGQKPAQPKRTALAVGLAVATLATAGLVVALTRGSSPPTSAPAASVEAPRVESASATPPPPAPAQVPAPAAAVSAASAAPTTPAPPERVTPRVAKGPVRRLPPDVTAAKAPPKTTAAPSDIRLER